MAKYCLKKPSKRLTCRKKFKIQRKVKEHSRKLKKLDKEATKKRKGKGDKPIAIPNKCPFKEQLLQEAEQRREQLKEEQVSKKTQQKMGKSQTKQNKRKMTNSGDTSMEALAKRAALEEDNYNASQYLVEMLPEMVEDDKGGSKSVRTFAGEVRKTIENAEIILEVLDARDPLGSRSQEIEKLVIESGKRLVLLLNKIDLVPKENLRKWLDFLRKEMPTIAFKASTQEQNEKLGRYYHSNLNSFSSKCIGADLVMKLLGNYCRYNDIKTSIRVGVVGFPNVGKSSVINSLKRKKSCQTGATPGITRQIQEIELDKHIRLIDSPGVVLAPKGKMDPAELSLKNALRVETLEDPITPINAILRRCSIKLLMLHYEIPEFSDCEEFLALLARRFGRLKKGGRPNLSAAARQVLNDWNTGKLRYYTEPPEDKAWVEQRVCAAELVTEFSKEFDLDALDQDIRVILEEIPQDQMAVETVYDPAIPMAEEEERMDLGEERDRECGRIVMVEGDGKGKKGVEGVAKPKEMDKAAANDGFMPDSLAIGDGNVQLNRAIKKAVKKRKKHQQKLGKKADKLAQKIEMGMELE